MLENTMKKWIGNISSLRDIQRCYRTIWRKRKER